MGALGIDVPTLIFQTIAFLVLVVVLGKWVYPTFIEAVDRREKRISDSIKAADAAQKAADNAGDDAAKLLHEARAEASEIIATAKQEATALLDGAEDKARAKAETIVASARDELDKDLRAAKKALRDETIELVALATEKVVGKAVTADVDATMIAASLKEVE